MVANSNNLIAIDLRGFGVRSDELIAADPLSKAAQEIATEIAAIGGQNIILVDHSLGGAVALLAA